MGKFVTQRDALIAEAAAQEYALIESLRWADAEAIPGLAAALANIRHAKHTAKALPSDGFVCAFHQKDGAAAPFAGPGRVLIEATAYYEWDEHGEVLSEIRVPRERPHYLVGCQHCAVRLQLGEHLATTLDDPSENLSEMRSELHLLRVSDEQLRPALSSAHQTIGLLNEHLDLLTEQVAQLTGELNGERDRADRLADQVDIHRAAAADHSEEAQRLRSQLAELAIDHKPVEEVSIEVQ